VDNPPGGDTAQEQPAPGAVSHTLTRPSRQNKTISAYRKTNGAFRKYLAQKQKICCAFSA